MEIMEDNISSNAEEIAYVPVRVLGRGAFGRAILYRRLNDGMLVVWKEMNILPVSERNRKEAYNEIEILSSLNHVNIIKYLNHFFDKDTLCIELEYANGGSLNGKINEKSEKGQSFSEDAIMWYFYQLMSAVVHIHSLGIQHRDIKPLNIFLTKVDILKLGDFGISKDYSSLSSSDMLSMSCVGTPYYMSPEIVRGESYDFSSDVWACGCVVYELLVTKRPFDATNALRLAREIVLADVSMDLEELSYSQELKHLCLQMLSKDRGKRPSSRDILQLDVFQASLKKFENRLHIAGGVTTDIRRPSSSVSSVASTTVSIAPSVVTSKSVTTELYIWGGGKHKPQVIETFSNLPVICVAAGPHHFSAVTREGEVYTWVDATCQSVEGELGHGDLVPYRSPRKVSHFEHLQQNISMASCGESFTICLANDGSLYSFGYNIDGCLGVEDELNADEPLLLGTFISSSIMSLPIFRSVICGDRHVLAITNDGRLYTWGCGEFGCLGQGTEEDQSLPKEIDYLPQLDPVVFASASTDASMIILESGAVYATGSNEHNKLGFKTSIYGLDKGQNASYDIPVKLKFSIVKPLKSHHIVHASIGTTHSVCVDATGLLLTFGDNRYGQLGQGDCKPRSSNICRVLGPLVGLKAVKAVAGNGFTVVAMNNGSMFSWGRNEHGELGISVYNAKDIPRPFPISQSWGEKSNCQITDISARAWHTVAIVERVHNQKVMQHGGLQSSDSLNPSLSGKVASTINNTTSDGTEQSFQFNSGAGKDVFNASPLSAEPGEKSASTEQSQPDKKTENLEESDVPTWLKNEFQEAEMASLYARQEKDRLEKMPEQSEDPAMMMQQMQELKSENNRLRALVSEQEAVIDELRKSLSTKQNNLATC